MTDEKYGPASFAATALAEPISATSAGLMSNPSSPVTPSPGSEAAPRSGVSPASVEAAPPSSDGPIGRVLNGRYKIKRLLGEGGMGGVYEGEHVEIGKRVAIKVVHALHARDPHIAARIKQEARSTGAIESENIVQVFDAGEDSHVGIFLVMEMLKGEDLSSLLARKGRVSPMAAATMVVQAAQGLLRAHAAGIVHRDLKPANIFISTRDDGSSLIKLVDFGIAKIVRDANRAHEAPGLTRMGMVIGTPQYMSPEQAQGLPSVDHKTDIYSLGAVLFEAIVGSSPFPEMPTYEQTILQIMTRPAPRLSSVLADVPPELDQLCADMMAHDANGRPADMAVVRERLVRIFPEIDGGRLPMRSLTNEVGFERTVSAADTSGQLRAQLDAAVARSGLSGVGLAVSRPATQPDGVMTAAAALEEPVALPGAAGPRRGILVGVVGVVALAAGIGIVALLKGHGATPPPEATAAYGLVQSTVSTVAASALPPPAPTEAAPAQPSLVVQVPPAALAPSEPKTGAPKSGRAHGQGTRATKAATPPASAPAAEKPAPAAARPVGGTSESTEF